jgi:gamma-glutamyltranspeptidase/glutathione hydrolase
MVAGVEELHRRFGRSEFALLLDRAVRLADDGFQVSAGLARGLARYWESLSEEALHALAADGRRPDMGDTLRQGKLAATLRGIAEGGSEKFYRGAAGREIVRELEAGAVTVEEGDLSFSPEWVEPLSAEYRGHQVFEVPPNSMGATTLMILKLLEEGDVPPPDSIERVTRSTEATKIAQAAKDAHLGDPRFVSFDLEAFLSSATRPRRSAVSEGDTTYFAVADGDGNLLSCIQSLFHPFGSRVYLKESGFFLNNRASAFKFEGPNQLAPKKRPLHTLSALLLSKREGESPYLAMGTSGGELRPQLHALLVSNVVDYSMDVEAALSYPRFVWNGEETLAERGYKVIDSQSTGVRLVDYPPRQGVAQGIQVTSEGKKAACDLRGDGTPAGF